MSDEAPDTLRPPPALPTDGSALLTQMGELTRALTVTCQEMIELRVELKYARLALEAAEAKALRHDEQIAELQRRVTALEARVA